MIATVVVITLLTAILANAAGFVVGKKVGYRESDAELAALRDRVQWLGEERARLGKELKLWREDATNERTQHMALLQRVHEMTWPARSAASADEEGAEPPSVRMADRLFLEANRSKAPEPTARPAGDMEPLAANDVEVPTPPRLDRG